MHAVHAMQIEGDPATVLNACCARFAFASQGIGIGELRALHEMSCKRQQVGIVGGYRGFPSLRTGSGYSARMNQRGLPLQHRCTDIWPDNMVQLWMHQGLPGWSPGKLHL